MTNSDKRELRQMCKEGHDVTTIVQCIGCSRATVVRYMKIFHPKIKKPSK